MECLEEGIPFLASSGSGGEELLDEESRHNNLFEPTVDGLCAKLLETLADGGMTARASFDPAQLLNPGKAVPALARCADYGALRVHGGKLPHADLPRF